ncbi:hypothetical protein Barb4_03034 [Bacteroidales bacterium Barb4]|nr:hypothetical protein Barb4_03034 [Bacteroidales bacterium Barb4]
MERMRNVGFTEWYRHGSSERTPDFSPTWSECGMWGLRNGIDMGVLKERRISAPHAAKRNVGFTEWYQHGSSERTINIYCYRLHCKYDLYHPFRTPLSASSL